MIAHPMIVLLSLACCSMTRGHIDYFPLVSDCYRQIVEQLDRSGTVEGFRSVPLLVTGS